MSGKNKRIERIVNIQIAEAHIKKGLKEMGCTDPFAGSTNVRKILKHESRSAT